MFKCRSCSSCKVSSIIPLGMSPLANALLTAPTPHSEPAYNLEVMLCEDCGLAQLKDIIDPAELFTDYVYFSSNSDTMLSSAAALVERTIQALSPNPFVVEIASNDGYLLKNYVKAGIDVLGIDPAQNIAKAANENGVPTLCDFFNEDLAAQLAESGKKADIIHANNVMAHVPDINGFIKGLKTLLKDDGKAIIEVPYFLDLVEKLEFDTIYHEHVYYFSVHPLKEAFARQGLEIFDIEKIKLHGGTLRLFVSHVGRYPSQPIIASMLQKEENFGLHQAHAFEGFMGKLSELKKELTQTLKMLKLNGARIAAYGASAKGTTLLNYCGVGKNMIEFVVDRSSAKNGKFTPGAQLPIFTPSRLIEENISHALMLTWNFAEEIMGQQKDFIQKGGKFIMPLPVVTVVP